MRIPFASDYGESEHKHREGDLYKVLSAYGRRFPIHYGYYEEIDRAHEPIEIYPDFLKEPVYTDGGLPFVTAMQHPCENFSGEADEDNTCYQCAHYERCEELLGVCRCECRRVARENVIPEK